MLDTNYMDTSVIESNYIQEAESQPPPKKKRGRKPKCQNPELKNEVQEVQAPKKRGRKPKGGKIVAPLQEVDNNVVFKENVILHLKCKLGSIEKQVNINNINYHNIELVNSKMNSLQFESLNKDVNNDIHNIQDVIENEDYTNDVAESHTSKEDSHALQSQSQNRKQINKKLKELQKMFYNDSLYGKRSSCFWCTCEFDSHPIYIPRSKVKNNYHVYGCFCSPECGVAHLMGQLIDTSQKYERYQMMNYIYGGIFDYKQNIKPAPDPHYLLDKFYGNMKIEEYRSLLNSHNLVMFIEKPLTHIFPELHDESYEQLSSKDKIIPSTSSFQIKRKSKKNTTKLETMMENFGFNA